MSDRIADVSPEDVSRIIRRDFANYDSKIVLEILNGYSSDPAAARVHLACLKLSQGNIEKLRKWIELSRIDFRDVLSLAEYARFYEIDVAGVGRLTRQEVSKLRSLDWNQYQEWLNRET